MADGGHKSFVEEKLKGTSNYSTWAVEMEMRLIEADLWDVVSHTIEELKRTRADVHTLQKKNERARAKIFLAVDKSMYLSLKRYTSARELWLALQTMYQDSGLERKLFLRSQLYNMKFEDCRDVPEYLNKAISLRAQLADMGVQISEEDMSCLLLMKLPKSYRPLVLSLESKELTVELIQSKLLSEENHQIMENEKYVREDENALVVNHRGQYHQNNYGRSKVQCYNCQRFGHIAKWCKSKKNYRPDNTAYEIDFDYTPEKRVEALFCEAKEVANNVTCKQSPVWVLDSGATCHLTKEKELLSEVRQVNKSIFLADNKEIRADAVGNINMRLDTGCAVRFEEVKYVPELQENLISVATLTEKGCVITFKKTKAFINNKYGKLIGTATRKGGFYILDIDNIIVPKKKVPVVNADKDLYGENIDIVAESSGDAEESNDWKVWTVVRNNRRRYIKKIDPPASHESYIDQEYLPENHMLKKAKKNYVNYKERSNVNFGNMLNIVNLKKI